MADKYWNNHLFLGNCILWFFWLANFSILNVIVCNYEESRKLQWKSTFAVKQLLNIASTIMLSFMRHVRYNLNLIFLIKKYNQKNVFSIQKLSLITFQNVMENSSASRRKPQSNSFHRSDRIIQVFVSAVLNF